MEPKGKLPLGQLSAFLAALKDAHAPWAVVALAALLLLTASCTIDADYIGREGQKLQTVCQGAKTTYLRMFCNRAGVDTAPETTPR